MRLVYLLNMLSSLNKDIIIIIIINLYRKIFGTSSYGEEVHLRYMNEFRIFYDIHSITFLLYTLK